MKRKYSKTWKIYRMYMDGNLNHLKIKYQLGPWYYGFCCKLVEECLISIDRGTKAMGEICVKDNPQQECLRIRKTAIDMGFSSEK